MTNIESIDLMLLMEHTLEGEGSKSHSFTHNYDYTTEVFKVQKWQIEGQWTNIGTGQNDCWMISNNDGSYLLVDSKELPSWKPQSNWKGDYLVSESSSFDEICQTQFELVGIEVHSVYSEEKIVIEEQVVGIEDEPTIIEEITPKEIAKVTVVVVSTTSMFAILSLFVINTESLRIPTTAAGLWLLGLIGKTQETTDGRFQRGRLMGYLTANPGCHFRALMAALGMSNGQITHHLRLLEQQELIWRLRDGRLVRYYPLNNSLYPGMNPDELPIPPLSPDPNSLQGKILSILDNEHQYGEFPTQAELAIKLEKSQQLISHHLRTLQKFGLVEKRKMGIKNRYKLTKEALFLLETDADFKD
jgi:DNA-binding transcriptional ArsR family regulator